MKFKDTIGVFPKLFTPGECKELIDLFEDYKKIGAAYVGENASGDMSLKNSIDYNLFMHEKQNQAQIGKVSGLFNQALDKYLDEFPYKEEYDHNRVVVNKTFYPLFQIQKYNKGEGHYNAWHVEKENANTARRMFVFILYLNDVEKGGETGFLFKERGKKDFFKVKPEIGKLIIHPASWPYIHKGYMPESDDKYILTTWLMYGE
jgi:hypothetical protein